MQKQYQPSEKFIDPVCLMKVSPNKPDIYSTYGAKTYHFCAEGCKEEFESNPGKFISAKPAKQKGWWGRYTDRLKKINCDRSMKCH